MAFIQAGLEAPFYIADKPAAMAIKEIMESLSLEDQYGQNKYTKESGYKDKFYHSFGNMVNSTFIPNFMKQSNKLVEQSFGLDAKRATNWHQAVLKGVPYFNQKSLETQYDNFGRKVTQFYDSGFLGITYDANKGGWSWLENTVEKRIDPYYQLYTDFAATEIRPKYYTEKETKIKEPVVYKGQTYWVDVKSANYKGGTQKDKTRITKSQGNAINALMGKYIAEGIDYMKEYLDPLKSSNPTDVKIYVKIMNRIHTTAKQKAEEEAWSSGILENRDVSNKAKQKTFFGKKGHK